MPTNEQRREAAKRKLDRQLARRARRAKRRRTYALVGSAAAVLLVVGLFVGINYLFSAAEQETEADAEPMPVPLPTPEPVSIPTETVPPPVRPEPLPATVDCQYPPTEQPAAREVEPPPEGSVSTTGTLAVTMQTNAGPVELTLDRALAPCTVHSFVSLARQDFYSGTDCHRLVTSPELQVLQCGDPTGQGIGGPGYTIPDEVFSGLAYGRGLVAMANTGLPDSGGSQFFLIFGEAQLQPAFTVFATISPAGLAVLDEIARAGHDGSLEPGPGGGKPNQTVTITTMEISD